MGPLAEERMKSSVVREVVPVTVAQVPLADLNRKTDEKEKEEGRHYRVSFIPDLLEILRQHSFNFTFLNYLIMEYS